MPTINIPPPIIRIPLPADRFTPPPFFLGKQDLSVFNDQSSTNGTKFEIFLLAPHDVLIDLGLLPFSIIESILRGEPITW